MVNKEDVKNHLEHILERGNERKKMANNLINNDDYINWLDDFTKVHPEIIILEIPNINYYCVTVSVDMSTLYHAKTAVVLLSLTDT